MSEPARAESGPALSARLRALVPELHRFRPRLLDAITGYDRGRFLADAGAGVTSASSRSRSPWPSRSRRA